MARAPSRDFGIPRTLAILAFAALVAYPLAQVLHRVDLAAPIPPDLLPVARVSLRQAGLSLLASLLVGVPLGVFYAGAWTGALRALATASFSLPGILAIGTVTTLFRGRDFRYGLPAVVFAHAFLNAPWIAVAAAEGIRSVPRAWVDAARTLGATRARAFARIEFPWIARRVALAAAQVFALCLTSFAIVMVLGGGPPVATLETEIYAAVRGGGLALAKAAGFAAAQLVLAAFPLILVAGLRAPSEYRDSLAGRDGAPTARSPRSLAAHALAAVWLALPGACFFAAVSPGRFLALLATAEFREAALVSSRIALSAAVASIALGGLFAAGARDSRFVRMLAGAPAGLSPLLVALGFFLAYSEYVDPFEGSVAGMVLVQSALFLPFALRFFLPLVDEEGAGPRRDLRRAARTLGASAFAAWRKLEWPRWRSAAARLGGLVFVWSFSEVATASFFGSERLTTVGVLLVRWLAQYRFEDVNAILFGIYLFSSAVLLAVGGGERE